MKATLTEVKKYQIIIEVDETLINAIKGIGNTSDISREEAGMTTEQSEACSDFYAEIEVVLQEKGLL